MKQNKMNKNSASMSGSMPAFDNRFNDMHSAPTFRKVRPEDRKFKLDERFRAVLVDERFQVGSSGKVDKYGRKLKDLGNLKNEKSELSSFYMLDDENDGKTKNVPEQVNSPSQPLYDDHDSNSELLTAKSKTSKKAAEKSNKIRKKPDFTVPLPTKLVDIEDRIDHLNRLARGEISGSESSSTEDSSDSDSVDSSDVESGTKGDEVVTFTGEGTNRLAILNCDWDNMKAVDILVLCSSFCPGHAVVRSVSVYRTLYGAERLEEEEQVGPLSIMHVIAQQKDKNSKKIANREVGKAKDGRVTERSTPGVILESEDTDTNKGNGNDDFDQDVLRAYEIQKVKYYIAVVECSTIAAAEAIYKEVDGMEFESSRIALDLQFVPEDQSFDELMCRETAVSVPPNYQPPNFIFKAMQQTKVVCTWDEAPTDRSKLIAGSATWRKSLSKGEDAAENFNAYLASSTSSSSDSENEEGHEKTEKQVNKAKLIRKALLGDVGLSDDEEEEEEMNDQDGKNSEMEYVPGDSSSIGNKGTKVDLLKAKLAERKTQKALEKETPWDTFQRKSAEKRKEKRNKKLTEKNADEEPDSEFEKPENVDSFFLEDIETINQDLNSEINEKLRSDSNSEDEQKAGMNIADESELALLLAGENSEEDSRNYDMRALVRQEKLKGKKLRGKRKRKEQARDVTPGQNFSVDVEDARFSAVLEGDSRFGIDKTYPDYKETEGMRTILHEVSKRRKHSQPTTKKSFDAVLPEESTSIQISSLVEKLKRNPNIFASKSTKNRLQQK